MDFVQKGEIMQNKCDVLKGWVIEVLAKGFLDTCGNPQNCIIMEGGFIFNVHLGLSCPMPNTQCTFTF